jgi:hypothetical protein
MNLLQKILKRRFLKKEIKETDKKIEDLQEDLAIFGMAYLLGSKEERKHTHTYANKRYKQYEEEEDKLKSHKNNLLLELKSIKYLRY